MIITGVEVTIAGVEVTITGVEVNAIGSYNSSHLI